MAVSDPVADMITKIRNASNAGFNNVDIYPSKLKVDLLKLLKDEGYIQDFQDVAENGKNLVRISLKYDLANKPVIHDIQKISKPGRRIYTGYKKIPRVKNGFGTILVSTSSGVITGKIATEKKVGGELICLVW